MSILDALAKAVAGLTADQRAALKVLLDEPAAPLAVIGLGCRMPGGADTPEAFFENLRAGHDAIVDIPKSRWDNDAYYDPDRTVPGKISTRWGGFLENIRDFDADFFQISPREATWMDPQQRLLLEVVYEALEHAGCGDDLGGSRTGVYVGVSASDYSVLPRAIEQVDAYVATGLSTSILANRISYALDLGGPSVTVDTACSSSLVATHLAARSLRNGECDLAIAAGVNLIISPVNYIAFSKWGMMAPDGRCKTFDRRADGFVRGEGCGAVILKRLSDARRDGDRVLALVRGSAINQDGKSPGLTAPNAHAQVDVVRRALADGGVDPASITYVEAHGTGTSLGDPIEVEALAEALGTTGAPCVLGAVKSHIGHLEGAAGIAGLIKAVLALHHREIPPNLHFKSPNPNIDFARTRFTIPTSPHAWDGESRFAGVSSFGFGGSNAHVVLQSAPTIETTAVEPRDGPHTLILSAASEAALNELSNAYVTRLEQTDDLEALVGAAARRRRLGYRRAVVGRSASTMAERLQKMLDTGRAPGVATTAQKWHRAPRIGFVFSGQGSLWAGMARTLVDTDPIFCAVFERLNQIFERIGGQRPSDALDDADRLARTDVAQPALFTYQVALAEALRARGITPDVVVGHSIGEVAAAHVAGVLSLEEAARIVHTRADLMQTCHGQGRMFEVDAPPDALGPLPDGAAIAAHNAPATTVISGDTQAVERLFERLSQGARSCRWLDVAYAFHSPQMLALEDQMIERLGTVGTTERRVTIHSTVSLAAKFDAHHWAANMGHPVQFVRAVSAMLEDGVDTIVELAPRPVLHRSLVACVDRVGAATVVRPSIRKKLGESTSFARLLASLFVDGAPVTYPTVVPIRSEPPPPYPWQRRSFWTAPPPKVSARSSRHPMLLDRIRSPAFDGDLYEMSIECAAPEYLASHVIGGRVIVPAAAWIDALFVAAEEVTGHAKTVLEGFEVHAPVEIDSDETAEVQLVLERGCATARRKSDAPASDWPTVFTAKLSVLEGHPPKGLDLDATHARCSEEVSQAVHYEDFAARGAELGPPFQSVKTIGRTDGEALGRLEATDEIKNELDRYVVHPAFLDAAVQLFMAAIPTATRSAIGGYLPVAIERIERHAAPSPTGWGHVVIRQATDAVVVADVALHDEDGRVVTRCVGLRYQRVERVALETRRLLSRGVFAVEWPPSSDEILQTPDGIWAVTPPSKRANVIAETLRDLGATSAVTPADSIPEEASSVVFVADKDEDLVCTLHRLAAIVSPARRRAPQMVMLVTSGVRSHPEQGALWAFMRVAGVEYPALTLRCVDVEDDAAIARALGVETKNGVFTTSEIHVPRLTRRTLIRKAPTPVSPTGTYLVTGGLGALGRRVAAHLVVRGAKSVVLVSRSRDEEGLADRLTTPDCCVRHEVADVADRSALERVFSTCAKREAAVRGVYHAAGVADDALIGALSEASVANITRAKVDGARHLSALTWDLPIDRFVLFSSAASVLGGSGQASYAAANAYLDGLAEQRRKSGRPALAIGWGPWADDGMAARLGEAAGRRAEAFGVRAMGGDVALAVMDQLDREDASVTVVDVDWTKFIARRGASRDPFFERVAAEVPTPKSSADEAFLRRLTEAPTAARRGLLTEHLRHHIAEVLELPKGQPLDVDAGLFDLGLDSMTAVELTERVGAALGAPLPATLVFDHPTVGAIADHVLMTLGSNAQQTTTDVEDASEDQLIAMLERELVDRG